MYLFYLCFGEIDLGITIFILLYYVYCNLIIMYTVVPTYPLIQNPRFQLYAVYRGPKKKIGN
jgi:hypothetical protein